MIHSLLKFTCVVRKKSLLEPFNSTKTKYNLKCCSIKTTHVSKPINNGNREKRRGGIGTIKMAYNSYESTNPSLTNRAPPIIIMHGLLGSKNNWNSITKFLHNKCRRKIFSVDARNHGDSPHTDHMSHEHLARDLLDFIHDFNIKETVLMGHGMGGKAMMLFAVKHPELVEKLIVIDVSPFSINPTMNFMPMYLEAMKKVTLNKNIRFAAAHKQADRQMAPHIIDSAIRHFFLTNLVKSEDGGYKWRVNITAIARNFYKISSFPLLTNTFEKPTFFVGGCNFYFIRREEHEEIRKIFKNAKFSCISGTGPLIHLEQPDKFIDSVCQFINEGNNDITQK